MARSAVAEVEDAREWELTGKSETSTKLLLYKEVVKYTTREL